LDGAQVGREPIAEDWGWALLVEIGPDKFILGCSAEEDSTNTWQVLIGDNTNRGLWPATRRRRTAAIEALTKQQVDTFLLTQARVTNVTVD
jgi:hypothetical protein